MGNTKLNQNGFTLIELLLVILVIAILSVVGITQFTNFGKDAREAALKANLQILRNGIAAQNGMMRTRCHVTDNTWPPLANLSANDITNGDTSVTATSGTPCTGAQIANLMDQKFVATGIPANPWAPQIAAANATAIGAASAAAITDKLAGNTGNVPCVAAHLRTAATAEGWCYNALTGEIWANSQCNDGTAACTAGNESTY